MTDGMLSAGLLRQGDVLLARVESIPDDRLVVVSDLVADRHVLAEGEATGHAHVVVGNSLRLAEWARSRRWAPDERRRYLFVEREARLVHEEHLPLVVPEGVYEVRRQREYSLHSARWVVD